MAFLEHRTPTLIAASVIALLALWVLAARPRNRLHQSLFLLLWCVAWAKGLMGWVDSTESLAARVVIYYYAAIVPAASYFVYRFLLAHRPGMRPRPWFGPLMVAAYVAIVITYVADPATFYEGYEGISRLAAMQYLAFSAIGLLMAIIATRIPPGLHRRSLSYLAVGISLETAYQALLIDWDEVTVGIFSSWDHAVMAVATFACLLGTIATVAVPLRGPGKAVLIIMAGLSSNATLLVWRVTDLPYGWVNLSTSAFWAILGTSFLTYCLLHCRLFGIELRLKSLLCYLATLALVAATFGAAALVLGTFSPRPIALGLGLVIALGTSWHMHVAARALVERAMPGIRRDDAYEERRSIEMYRAAVQEAAAAGRISSEAQHHLVRLQRSLGIPTSEATRLERKLLEGNAITDLPKL